MTRFHRAYRTASFADLAPDTVRAIKAPALGIVGDADVVRPEHAVELVWPLGVGVAGDDASGRPHNTRSRLGVLPGLMHATLVDRVERLLSLVSEFLDAPMPEAK